MHLNTYIFTCVYVILSLHAVNVYFICEPYFVLETLFEKQKLRASPPFTPLQQMVLSAYQCFTRK